MRSIGLLALTLLIGSQSLRAELPQGWVKIGDGDRSSYDVQVLADAGIDGAGLYVARIANSSASFSGVGQSVASTRYAGKKVRLAASLKTVDVDGGYAGIWIRVDKGAEMLMLNNMNQRGVTGTTDWSEYETVILVDPSSTTIVFGALLVGEGSMYADRFSLDIVPDDTPLTDDGTQTIRDVPINLDF